MFKNIQNPKLLFISRFKVDSGFFILLNTNANNTFYCILFEVFKCVCVCGGGGGVTFSFEFRIEHFKLR